ncbi:MAG: hypothetical protein QOE82_2085 [Thermoanaerobaculia bacterium]|jgi:hypothetical protein|nr:hypothetical protein [Thermoanaerobaculia bacterium]
MYERQLIDAPPDHQSTTRSGYDKRPRLRRFSAFSDWALLQPLHSRTSELLENGYVAEALSSDDGIPRPVLAAAGQAYEEIGWLKPAAIAFTAAGDRAAVANIAARWLDSGLFEAPVIALDRIAMPISEEMLDRYFRSCRENGWLPHAAATAMRASI